MKVREQVTARQVLVPRPEYWDTRVVWQVRATEALDWGTRFLDILCHRGARKTTFQVNTLIRESLRHSRRSYAYIGPTHVEAKATVWTEPTMLFRWLPDQADVPWTKNETDTSITFPNKSVLRILGADKPDSIRGFNPYGVAADEWSLCKGELWHDILAPIMRRSVDRWCAFCYTSQGESSYAHELSLKTKGDPEWFHAVIRASESGIIPKAELEAMKRTMPDVVYRREMECEDIADEEFVLITSAMIDKLPRQAPAQDPYVPGIVSCDPAFGGDECSIDVHWGHRILETRQLRTKNTDEIIGVLKVLSDTHRIYDFIVDEIGNGRAVLDPLMKDERYHVIAFNSSNSTANKLLYNKRAEAYWHVREEMLQYKGPYPADPETRRQLPAASRFKMPHGPIQIVGKDEIRKKIGCSPDRADSYVMARYGLQFARPCTGAVTRFVETLVKPRSLIREYDPFRFVEN